MGLDGEWGGAWALTGSGGGGGVCAPQAAAAEAKFGCCGFETTADRPQRASGQRGAARLERWRVDRHGRAQMRAWPTKAPAKTRGFRIYIPRLRQQC